MILAWCFNNVALCVHKHVIVVQLLAMLVVLKDASVPTVKWLTMAVASILHRALVSQITKLSVVVSYHMCIIENNNTDDSQPGL